MLDYLVTSKARRRLLLLLWVEGAHGSASALADRAGVGFASAYRELQAMRRLDLVSTQREGGALAFAANQAHPMADTLVKLLSPTSLTPTLDPNDAEVRSQLAALGAPVLAEHRKTARGGSVEETLVDGVVLAHRDPAVARAMPVTFFRQRDQVDPDRLLELARDRAEKAAVGMFLDLTTEVSGDRRFAGWARKLRDRRVHTRRPFFYTRGAALRGKQLRDSSPALAHRWGYRFDLALDDLQSMFDKAKRAS